MEITVTKRAPMKSLTVFENASDITWEVAVSAFALECLSILMEMNDEELSYLRPRSLFDYMIQGFNELKTELPAFIAYPNLNEMLEKIILRLERVRSAIKKDYADKYSVLNFNDFFACKGN